MLKDPSLFDKKFALAEFQRISSSVDIGKIDIVNTFLKRYSKVFLFFLWFCLIFIRKRSYQIVDKIILPIATDHSDSIEKVDCTI